MGNQGQVDRFILITIASNLLPVQRLPVANRSAGQVSFMSSSDVTTVTTLSHRLALLI
jgi:hypothetical protein